MVKQLLKTRIIASFFAFSLLLNLAQAQQRICTSYVPYSGYPDSLFVDLKNMEAGQAYVKCWLPNEYETFADSNFIVEKSNIITKNQEIIAVKPIIEEVTDSIILKKKYSKWVINTAIKPPKECEF